MTGRERKLMNSTIEAKYDELIESGMSEEDAIQEATEYAECILEDIADQKMEEEREARYERK